jgi:hypothetical protein
MDTREVDRKTTSCSRDYEYYRRSAGSTLRIPQTTLGGGGVVEETAEVEEMFLAGGALGKLDAGPFFDESGRRVGRGGGGFGQGCVSANGMGVFRSGRCATSSTAAGAGRFM